MVHGSVIADVQPCAAEYEGRVAEPVVSRQLVGVNIIAPGEAVNEFTRLHGDRARIAGRYRGHRQVGGGGYLLGRGVRFANR